VRAGTLTGKRNLHRQAEVRVTKNDLAMGISREVNLKHADVKRIVQMVLDGIADAVLTEGRIELRNFGVFEVRTRTARRARNPRTREEVFVPERKVVVFKPGRAMIERLRAGGAPPESRAPSSARGRSEETP
jgi:nucleoid DNA-binding protein